MKTFRMIEMALVAVMFSFAMSSCDEDDEDYKFTYVNPYKDYPQLIVGQWFNFTPDASMFLEYHADNTCKVIGWDKAYGHFSQFLGTYRLEGNKLTDSYIKADGSKTEISKIIEIIDDKLVFSNISDLAEAEERVHYRVKESFAIEGSYSYLNSLAKVEPAEGKTALQLPEGLLFNGQNSIPVDAMHGDRIIDVMKKFFADATFAADGKLYHTMEGEAKVKNYTLDGNNLSFNLYEGSDTYKVNATSFPDEDGDRLFVIIPKQAAWLGGMVDLVEKENDGLKLDAVQIAALEKEFMDTFETFTVILSLSKK